MCEAVVLSHRSKKELFVPIMTKNAKFHRESYKLNEKKAKILDFSAKGSNKKSVKETEAG